MRSATSIGVLFAAVGTLTLPGQSHAQASLQGAWSATGWTRGGQPVATPQRGLLVFTRQHYSIMFVSDDKERAHYTGDNMTDAEKLAAYNSITANSGSYAVSGDKVTIKAYMAKDPNYMGEWVAGCATGPCPNDVVLTFKIVGSTMTVTWPQDFGGFGGLVGTFRRVE